MSSAVTCVTSMGLGEKVTSFAASSGAASTLGEKPLPCLRAIISSELMESSRRSSSSESWGSFFTSISLESMASTAASKSVRAASRWLAL